MDYAHLEPTHYELCGDCVSVFCLCGCQVVCPFVTVCWFFAIRNVVYYPIDHQLKRILHTYGYEYMRNE